MSESLHLTRNGSILEITLDRPKANAIDAKTSFEMGEVFLNFRDDPQLRVAIITGAGEKFFSAGWDLKAAAEGEAPDADFGPGGFAGLTEIFNLDKPVIAAVNGYAFGGGFELALAADFIVCADNASFALPEAKLGIVPDSGGVLPDFTEGQAFEDVDATITEHFTSPPKPYTEDTLLFAMENAGKEDIPEDAERKGLGTPATRAAIIEKLVAAGFVERKGKNLIPTKAGINLVTVLPEALTSPMLTAEWEQRLCAVAKGEADPGEFMDGIRSMTRELIQTYSHISEDGQKLFAPEKEVIGNCPRCGKPVYEGKKNFACSDRSCTFVLWKNDRFWTSRKKELTKKMAADLLKKGRTNVKGMWSEKKGAAYDAAVILDDTGGKFINFKLEFPKRKGGANGRK